MIHDNNTSYGCYVNGEIYYWNEYLNRKGYFETELAIKPLKEKGEKVNEKVFNKIFIEKGYENVSDRLRNDIECENYIKSENILNKLEEASFENSNDFYRCESCQENTCMYSDR